VARVCNKVYFSRKGAKRCRFLRIFLCASAPLREISSLARKPS
jgi:hypothetical protein